MLEITNVVNVSVVEAPLGLSDYKVNNIALFTKDTPVSVDFGDYGVFVSAAAVGDEFGVDSDTYKIAVAGFSQQPNILAGGGSLAIIPFKKEVATFSIADGSTGYAVNDVLTIVQSGAEGATLKVDTIDGDGTITGATLLTAGAGYSAAVGLATTGGSGTGATITIATVQDESLAEAIARMQDAVYFCGILSTDYGSNSTWEDLADSVQAYGDKMLFLPSATYTDVAGAFTAIKDANNSRTRCLFHSASALASKQFAAAYAFRGMSTNFDGSNTTLTMNLKPLVTITADDYITQTRYTQLAAAGVDSYVNTAGLGMATSFGANRYFDEVFNLIWFVGQLKVNGFNALRQVGGKVPQTEAGMQVLISAYRRACEQGIRNAYIAAGSWTSPETFGDQEAFLENIKQRGYYIYSIPVNQQDPTDREAREAPLLQNAVKQAGAIHSSNVLVYINR